MVPVWEVLLKLTKHIFALRCRKKGKCADEDHDKKLEALTIFAILHLSKGPSFILETVVINIVI